MTEYDASQKQRAYERRIRATKRELTMLDTGIKETDNPSLKENLQAEFDRKSVLLKKQEAKIKDFTHQTGLYRDRAREQSYGFNKSVSQKVVMINKKVLEKAAENAKIIEEEKRKIREKILSGEIPLKLNVGNQNKHITTSHSYRPEDKKSYLFGNLETAQELVNQYHGTGEIKLSKDLKWTNKEIIELENDIGVTFDIETGEPENTNRFAIHYGKKGTHVVPIKRRITDEVKAD